MTDDRTSSDNPGADSPAGSEPVWTYRGYQLRASEFTTAMVHFFRAEVPAAPTSGGSDWTRRPTGR